MSPAVYDKHSSNLSFPSRRQGQSQNPGGSNNIGNAPSSTQTPSSSSSSLSLTTPTPTTSPSITDPSAANSVRLSTIVSIAAVIGVALIVLTTFTILQHIRRRHANPRYIPSSYLKKLWTKWTPSRSKPAAYRDSSGLEALSSNTPSRLQSSINLAAEANSAANIEANAAIDRHASVRSVMTLPAYHYKAGETEQVLGREGERAGIDTVVEFPEGEEEAEHQRDEEMEALYQVRLARRNQIAEREERERLRAEARARGDTAAIRELRNARFNNTPSTIEAARAIHEAVKSRGRTVSSVSYADLGVARHDGTRVRANSEESERPLLGDAASMAESRRPSSTATFTMGHERNASTHSLASIGTYGSGDLAQPRIPVSRSRAGSGASLGRIVTTATQSSPDLMDYPSQEPPGYVNVDLNTDSPINVPPPGYFSPTDITTNSNSDSDPTVSNRHHNPSDPNETSTTQLNRQSQSSPDDIASAILGPAVSESRRLSGGIRTSGRGVGGVPQLPSLRLSTLPRINISEPTPIDRVRRVSEEFD